MTVYDQYNVYKKLSTDTQSSISGQIPALVQTLVQHFTPDAKAFSGLFWKAES
jgi:hypothetical protein